MNQNKQAKNISFLVCLRVGLTTLAFGSITLCRFQLTVVHVRSQLPLLARVIAESQFFFIEM